MNGPLDAHLAAELADLEARGLLRRLERDPGEGAIDFRSNDTLGLSRDPQVIAAACEAAREFGAGGRAARLLGGGALHARVEEAAARWLDAEAALFFPSGWQANAGVIGALAGRGDALVSDELVHASLIDAARLSRARIDVAPHLDLAAFDAKLAAARGARRRFVVVESVFGMDGDVAPLVDLHALCVRHDADLIVDEAHAAGVLGPRGAGLVVEAGGARWPRLVARVITGGKALGVSGAFVVGSRALRDVVLNRARSFVFTTAAPPQVAGALLAAIARVTTDDAGREQARSLARDLARRLDLSEPAAAIVPIPVGDPRAVVALGERCASAGFAVAAVRPPTVPDGTSRLRVTCHAFNDAEQVRRLAELLADRPRGVAVRESSESRPRRALVVVGTDTGVGKTIVSAILLHAARRLGAARYWKPVQTGDESDTREVLRLSGAAADAAMPPLHEFPLPASPHTAAKAARASIDPHAVLEALASRARDASGAPLIVELAGGLRVPYTLAFDQADLLARSGAACVLVARSGLGTLNHTSLTLEALDRRRLAPRALFLVGEPHAENAATLRAIARVPRIIEVPRLAPLDAAAIDRFVARHDLSGLFAP